MKWAYFLIDFFTIIVPFCFSFHPKLQFYKTWKAFFPAVLMTSFVFVLWDIYFTGIGAWGFNPAYVCGVYFGNLPIEEILFFICIPYSCIFTFFCLDVFIKNAPSKRFENVTSIILIIASFVFSIIFHEHKYTLASFVLLAALLILAKYYLKITWLGKFYLIYGILIFPFFIVNGILTGTGIASPIVWYKHSEIIGIRILTIPVEDIFYGMDLILMNLIIYKSKFFWKAGLPGNTEKS